MKKQIKITAETAELLHGKSYTWFAPSVYWKDVNGDYELASYYDPVHDHIVCKYKAPTQALLQKWLREIHNIDLWAAKYTRYGGKTEYIFHIFEKNPNPWFFNTYEDALEKGLQEALKLVA